jgi:hypothetical protein
VLAIVEESEGAVFDLLLRFSAAVLLRRGLIAYRYFKVIIRSTHAASFDDLVGADQNKLGDLNPEGLGLFLIDYKIKYHRLFDKHKHIAEIISFYEKAPTLFAPYMRLTQKNTSFWQPW